MRSGNLRPSVKPTARGNQKRLSGSKASPAFTRQSTVVKRSSFSKGSGAQSAISRVRQGEDRGLARRLSNNGTRRKSNDVVHASHEAESTLFDKRGSVQSIASKRGSLLSIAGGSSKDPKSVKWSLRSAEPIESVGLGIGQLPTIKSQASVGVSWGRTTQVSEHEIEMEDLTPKPLWERALNALPSSLTKCCIRGEEEHSEHHREAIRIKKTEVQMNHSDSTGSVDSMSSTRAHDASMAVTSLKITRRGGGGGTLTYASALQLAQMPWFQSTCIRIATNPMFDALMGFIVVLNTASIVMESEMSETANITMFDWMNRLFLGVFTIELVMRLTACGLRKLLSVSSLWLDIVIVLTGWLYEIMFASGIQGSSELRIVQALKILRVLRAVRVLRMLTMFQHLWLIVQSFFLCMKPLLSVMFFILIVMFLFAMFAVELMGPDGTEEEPEVAEVQHRLRSIVPGMWTIFQIMTLDEWYSICEPLLDRFPASYLFFLPLICITSLTLMNLVTAVVVDVATRETEAEEEQRYEVFESEVAKKAESVKEMFDIMDDDGNGAINEEEFVRCARLPKMLQDIWADMEIHHDEELRQIFYVICGLESGTSAAEVPIPDMVHFVSKLQVKMQDELFVAAIRNAKTPTAKAVQVKSHLNNKDREIYDVYGAFSKRLDEMAHNVYDLCSKMSELRHMVLNPPVKMVALRADGSVDLSALKKAKRETKAIARQRAQRLAALHGVPYNPEAKSRQTKSSKTSSKKGVSKLLRSEIEADIDMIVEEGDEEDGEAPTTLQDDCLDEHDEYSDDEESDEENFHDEEFVLHLQRQATHLQKEVNFHDDGPVLAGLKLEGLDEEDEQRTEDKQAESSLNPKKLQKAQSRKSDLPEQGGLFIAEGLTPTPSHDNLDESTEDVKKEQERKEDDGEKADSCKLRDDQSSSSLEIATFLREEQQDENKETVSFGTAAAAGRNARSMEQATLADLKAKEARSAPSTVPARVPGANPIPKAETLEGLSVEDRTFLVEVLAQPGKLQSDSKSAAVSERVAMGLIPCLKGDVGRLRRLVLAVARTLREAKQTTAKGASVASFN